MGSKLIKFGMLSTKENTAALHLFFSMYLSFNERALPEGFDSLHFGCKMQSKQQKQYLSWY